ncbi:MAG: DUF2752 domain-containing protein [Cyclobacteriaceae bacterium]
MTAKKLYWLLSILWVSGACWVTIHFSGLHPFESSSSVCLIKNASGIPCPSCGTTRAVLAIMEGDFTDAFMMNPFGFLMAALMLIIPFWLLIDLILGRTSLYSIYLKAEEKVRHPQLAIPLIALVAINWIWNIYKGI